MGHTEGTTTSLGILLIIGGVVFALSWAVTLAYTIVMYYMRSLKFSEGDKYRTGRGKRKKMTPEGAERRTMREMDRKWILTYTWAALALICIMYWAMFVEQGTITRKGDHTKVNWSRWAFEGGASVMLALALGVFFWFRPHLFVNFGMGAVWLGAFLSLLLGTLESSDKQRVFWWVLSAILFLAVSVWLGIAGQLRLIAISKKGRGPVPLLVGWIVLIMVALCMAGYWLIWGLSRANENLVGLDKRWQGQVAFFVCDIFKYCVVPVILYVFHHPEKSHFVDSFQDGLESNLVASPGRVVRDKDDGRRDEEDMDDVVV